MYIKSCMCDRPFQPTSTKAPSAVVKLWVWVVADWGLDGTAACCILNPVLEFLGAACEVHSHDEMDFSLIDRLTAAQDSHHAAVQAEINFRC